MGSGQWVQNELHPFNCNTVPGGQANYYVIGPASASIGAPVGCGVGGGEPPAAGGGYIQIEGNSVSTSLPTWGTTAGYPTNTPLAGLETGTLAHKSGYSGLVALDYTTEGCEAHDWSAFGGGGDTYTGSLMSFTGLLKTHRGYQRKTSTNNAYVSFYASLDTPLEVSSSLSVGFIGALAYSTTQTAIIGFCNAENKQLRIEIGSDASIFFNATSRYYNGSSWTYGTTRQRQSGNTTGTYNLYESKFDPALSYIETYGNDAEIWNNLNEYPDYPGTWPGWETFGAITSIYGLYGHAGANQYAYSYALKAVFA
jgi:hypothetical protein